jgi:hypothetical protein
MRYKHETFNKIILKDGFISFLFKFRCHVSLAVIFSDRMSIPLNTAEDMWQWFIMMV